MNKKRSYFKVFILAFLSFALTISGLVIYNKGLITYYGDFNSQQIPFYLHVHQAVKNGKILWDWGTDLGSGLIGSYSFYMLGSPFFWLSLLFPSSAVLYLMPWLLCLKYAVAALTSYAYIRRFTVKDSAAVTGAFLYAFSGFQMYNVFFNHFHDVTAFFPLLLIALEENAVNNRRGFFALTVMLMASINYFFFAGQAVFLVIYFLMRSCCKDFKVKAGHFFCIILEFILGAGAAAVLLLPSAFSILDNYRVSERLYGMNMLTYNDKTRIWRIIKNCFMIADPPAELSIFSSGTAKWSSIAGYLPMFSMIGVLSFLRYKPDKWQSRILRICIAASFVPILNSAFYMFNASYYARWFYMPVLIMALVTAISLERYDIPVKAGIRGCVYFFILIFGISFIPSKEDDELKWFALTENKLFFYISLAVTILLFLMAVSIFKRKEQRKPFFKRAAVLTIVSSFICSSALFYYGIYCGPMPEQFIAEGINGKENIQLDEDGTFFRTDISEHYDNYPMLWGYSSMRCFQSVVSPSIMEFYDSIGITRDVASRADTSYYALRGLLSVKYYFSKLDEQGAEKEKPELPGFTYISDQNGFAIYKNDYYVPMGFTYNSFISEEKFNSFAETTRTNLLMDSIVLNEEQIQKYGTMFSENADKRSSNDISREKYIEDCKARINSSCYEFTTSSKGFFAKINTEQSNLVFFSVPYEEGFSAKVNGVPAVIEKVSNGFMAVPVSSGESTIEISYIPKGLKEGYIISICSFILILIYFIMCHFIITVKNRKAARLLACQAVVIVPDEHTQLIRADKNAVIDIILNNKTEE